MSQQPTSEQSGAHQLHSNTPSSGIFWKMKGHQEGISFCADFTAVMPHHEAAHGSVVCSNGLHSLPSEV